MPGGRPMMSHPVRRRKGRGSGVGTFVQRPAVSRPADAIFPGHDGQAAMSRHPTTAWCRARLLSRKSDGLGPPSTACRGPGVDGPPGRRDSRRALVPPHAQEQEADRQPSLSAPARRAGMSATFLRGVPRFAADRDRDSAPLRHVAGLCRSNLPHPPFVARLMRRWPCPAFGRHAGGCPRIMGTV